MPAPVPHWLASSPGLAAPPVSATWLTESPTAPSPRYFAPLTWALIICFVAHGLALVGMVVCLLPALPGGGSTSDAQRVLYIATHPWLFRLGWLPWQLSAISDLLLALAMVRTPRIPRGASWFVLCMTILAIVPDQGGQALWITRGVHLAQQAQSSHDLGPYLMLERRIFSCTAGWAALLYTLAGIGWSVGLATLGAWDRTLSRMSWCLWGLMLLVAAAPLGPAAHRPSPAIVAAGNAVGFLLLQVWLLWALELQLRLARPFVSHGRDARWTHPGRGFGAWLAELVANSRTLSALCDPLPIIELVSDITDVVYASYVIEAARLQPLCPRGLELQRLGPGGEFALITFLTFRHGHFGPRFLGRWRRFLPSPIQSNWRIHVFDPSTEVFGIYFITNATSSTLHALMARLLTQGMPMHLLQDAALTRSETGEMSLMLRSGHGSAPDAMATLYPSAPPPADLLPAAFRACFPTFTDHLFYCVPQDRALSTQPALDRVTRHEIDLGIPLAACEPLSGQVCSKAMQHIVGDMPAVCFRVPSVQFRFALEIQARLSQPAERLRVPVV